MVNVMARQTRDEEDTLIRNTRRSRTWPTIALNSRGELIANSTEQSFVSRSQRQLSNKPVPDRKHRLLPRNCAKFQQWSTQPAHYSCFGARRPPSQPVARG